MAPENALASGHPGSQGWRQSIPGQGSPQGLRVRPRERCDMSGPSQPGKFYPTYTRAPPGSFLPSWSPTHVLSHGAHPPVNLDLILRWGGWPRRQGARHTILYLLALAQKVSSATFPGLSTGRYFTMKRWGWGGGSERKGRKEGRRKEEGRKTTSPKAFCWYTWLQLCISNIWYTWLQLGPSVSSVSLYLPFTHAINCVFLYHASIGNHQLSPQDKLNQVLRAFFSLQLTRRLAYIRGASLRALCDHKQGCSRMYTPNYAFTCSLETLVIMFYYWSPPQHNELWWNNETALAPEQSGWRPPQLRPPMRTIARAERPAPVAASGRKSWQPAPPSPPPAPAPTAGPAPWVTEMPRPIGNEAQTKKAGVQGVGEQKSSMRGGHNHPSITLFCADGETEAQKGETTPPNAHSGGGGIRSQISCLLIECVSSARFFS